MEQKTLITVARKWWVILIAAAVTGAIVARIVAAFIQPSYESSVRLLTGPTNTDEATLAAAGGLARTYAELATSQLQLQTVAKDMGLNLAPDKLAATVKSTSNDVTRIVSITASRPTADGAREFAQRLADRMVALSRASRVQNTALTDELLRSDAFTGLSATQLARIRAATTDVLSKSSPGELTVVDPPRAASAPASPRVPLLMLLGAALGLALAGVLIVRRERSTGTIDSARDLTDVVGAPMLGVVSGAEVRATLVARSSGGGDAVAQIRRVADEIDYLARNGSLRSVVVVGPDRLGPSGAVAANVAAALAEPGFRVVVVDADPEGAQATELFHLSDRPGLADRTRADEAAGRTGDWAARLGVPRGADLTVIPAGTAAEGHRRIDPARVREIVDGLEADADMVLVIPPGAKDSSDALVWAEAADGVLLVAEQGTTTAADITGAESRLAAVGATMVGTVLCTARTIPGLSRLIRPKQSKEAGSDRTPPPTAGSDEPPFDEPAVPAAREPEAPPPRTRAPRAATPAETAAPDEVAPTVVDEQAATPPEAAPTVTVEPPDATPAVTAEQAEADGATADAPPPSRPASRGGSRAGGKSGTGKPRPRR